MLVSLLRSSSSSSISVSMRLLALLRQVLTSVTYSLWSGLLPLRLVISPCWGSPTLLSWDQALFFLLTRSLLLNLFPLSCCYSRCLFVVEGPPVFWDQALSFLLLGFYLSAPCCCLFVGAHLDAAWITAPLPWKDYSRQPVVSAVAVRAFCLLGSDLLSPQAQGKACWTRMPCWHDQISSTTTVAHARVRCP